MYAAAFAPEATMRLLLTAGANVNAANQNGATALMWATHDAAKVRLLLGRGADVDAARPDGATAVSPPHCAETRKSWSCWWPQEPTSARVRSRRPGH